MFLKNWLMILSLLLLNACDCSVSDGCALFAVETVAVIASPVTIVANPIIRATARGPEPKINSEDNRIKLESNFEPGATITSIQNSQSGFLIVSQLTHTLEPETSFWTWQGQSSDFGGHRQPGMFFAESPQKLFFVDSPREKNAIQTAHSVGINTGALESLSLPSCYFSHFRIAKALSDKKETAYCVDAHNETLGFDPITLKTFDLYEYAHGSGFPPPLLALKSGVIGILGNSVSWQEFGPKKLSGAYTLDGEIWSITPIPNSNMAAISFIPHVGAGTDDYHRGEVVLLDLVSRQVKFKIQMDIDLVETVASPDGDYLLAFSSISHQIDVYDLINFKLIGSISTGERYHFGRAVFESNNNRFATYIRDKVYIFNLTTH